MLHFIGKSVISYLEKEFVNHSPEVQSMILVQLDKFTSLLFDYVQQKMLDKSQAINNEEAIDIEGFGAPTQE